MRQRVGLAAIQRAETGGVVAQQPRRAVPIAGEGAEIEVDRPENLTEFPIDPAGDRLVLAGSPFHHPLADDAAFSEVNVFFALKDYGKVVARAELGTARHPKSNLKTSFEYMAALGFSVAQSRVTLAMWA